MAPTAIEELNAALLEKAVEAKVLKTNRVRADTTVIEANVAYPSDSGLLAKGVAKMAKTVKVIKKLVLRAGRDEDRTRTVHRRSRDIAANLRRRSDDATDEVRRINSELVEIAIKSTKKPERSSRNARRKLKQPRRGRLVAIVDELAKTADRTERSPRSRRTSGWSKPDGATPIVSLHDPDARPIVKGRLGKPVEFGYKAQLVDNEDGVILDHNVELGNPRRNAARPAIAASQTRPAAPRAVTADRGYGDGRCRAMLHELGVRYVVLPTKGQAECADGRSRATRRSRLVRWRTGCEGRISCAKRDFGSHARDSTGSKGQEPGVATGSSPTIW